MSTPGRSEPPRLRYEPALDGVRAVAIAVVVLWHASSGAWPVGGFLGVHMFFVLSGFLITTLLVLEWQRRGSISLLHFYRRRALRLFPALAVMLATYVVIQTARALVLDPGALDLWTAVKGAAYGAFYVSNIVQAHGLVLAIPVSHLWSLAAEEQFYVVWPCVLLAALRLGARPRTIQALLLALIALIAAHRLQLAAAGADWRRLYFAPDTGFDTILLGCVIGITFTSRGAAGRLERRSVLDWAWIPAALMIAGAIAFGPIESRSLYGAVLLPFGIATAVLLLALVWRRRSLLRAVLATTPFVFLGRISYSLYLWHPMILWFGRREFGIPAPVGVALSVGVATASYYFVELPFLRLKNRGRPRQDPAAEAPAATLESRAPARASSVSSIRPAAGAGAKKSS